MIPIQHFVMLLDRHFFPKWFQVFSRWLSSQPNYDEVVNWYSGWKKRIGPELNAEVKIKCHFNTALDMMNHTVSGTYQPSMYERRSDIPMAVDPVMARSILNASNAPASLCFKDVIEKLAGDNGLIFMPAPGQRRYEGKAVYCFGKSLIYFNKNVVFVINRNSWIPVSAETLLAMSI